MTTKPSTTDAPQDNESSQEPSNESRMAEWMAAEPAEALCKEFLSAFETHCEVAEIERSIRERQQLSASSHAEITERDRALLELSAERKRLLDSLKVESSSAAEAQTISPATSPMVMNSAPSDAPEKAGRERDVLTRAILTAQQRCGESSNANAVWLALTQMAKNKEAPLVGVVPEGIQWLNAEDEPCHLSLRNLRDRLRRKKPKTR